MKRGDCVITGRFIRPIGLKGELLFRSYSGSTAHLSAVTSIFLERNMLEYRVEYWFGLDRKTHGKLRCKLVSIDTAEEAKQFSGQDVMIPRVQAASLSFEEYYISDIVGLEVCSEGSIVGKIIAVSDSELQPLLHICWNSGKTALIPFNQHFFHAPDMSSHVVELREAYLVEHS